MRTLAEFRIIVGAENNPPMLEKSLYDSWKSHMEFYMENRENGRIILDSLQADCDCKATNIVLQGLPPNVYAIFNHHKVAKEIWDRVKLLMQGTKLSLQEKEYKLYDEFDKFTFVKVQANTKFLNSRPSEWSLAVPVFKQRDDPIACLNKAMDFLIAVASSRFHSTNNRLRTSSNPRNQATIQDDKLKRPRNVAWFKEKEMLAKAHEVGQILDEEQLAFLADPGIPDGKTAQTTISNTAAF
ncbi:hypothetical protein Tco_1525620 [Tanacetum coccineum]